MISPNCAQMHRARAVDSSLPSLLSPKDFLFNAVYIYSRKERRTLAGVTMVGATLAAMIVCDLREAARMVAMRGTALTMWNMVNSVEKILNEITCLC